MGALKNVPIILLLLRGVIMIEEDFFDKIVVPSEVLILAGETVFLKILTPVRKQTKCEYQVPGEKDRNTMDFSVSFSDDECGIKIMKVEKTHQGVWKLFSTFENGSSEITIKGTSVLTVQDPMLVPVPEIKFYSPTDNFAPDFDLNYCYVYKDMGSNGKISELGNSKCMIPQDLDDDFRDGEWMVRVGVKGIPTEISFTVNIESTGESITTIVTKGDNENIKLSCQVKNLKNIIKYCRFERIAEGDNFGLNLEDGTASGNYRYFGQGFDKGDCGLEITSASLLDKAQWICFLGLMDVEDAENLKISNADKKIYKYSSVIDASEDCNRLKILNEETVLYQVDNESAIIQCNANNPFDRCWFQHPVHRILAVSDTKAQKEDDGYEYYGNGFQMGHCGLKIKKFFVADAGNWKCGVGQTKSMKEAVKAFKIEVATSFLMAVTKQLEDFSGNLVLIQCKAIPTGSLATCQFISPNGEAFTIDERITRENAINGLYYFDPNRKLSDGYCSVVIKELRKEHAGKWICNGRVLGRNEESYDSIYISVDGKSKASFSWLTISIVLPLLAVMILSIAGTKLFRIYRRRRILWQDNLGSISMTELRSNASSEGSTTSI